MHPVVVMAYEKTSAIVKAVAALEEAGETVIVLSTGSAKLIDFLSALAADVEGKEEEKKEKPAEEKPAELPAEEPKVEEDVHVPAEQKLIVDGEEIAVQVTEGTSELRPGGLMVGAKTAYTLNESHYSFWPVSQDGMFDLVQQVQVQLDDKATFTNVQIKEAAEKPLLKLNKEVLDRLIESKRANIEVDDFTFNVIKQIESVLRDVAEENQDKQVAATSVASAPDTTKFRAMKSGFIRVEKNVVTYGYGNHASKWDVFLKIGGAIDSNVARQIQNDALEDIGDDLDRELAPYTTIDCNDGQIFVAPIDGTNWGGLGFSVHVK